MNNAERLKAILNYQDYDRMPVVHFGFWPETLQKWQKEGHITKSEAEKWIDGNRQDFSISEKLGFDFNYFNCYDPCFGLYPVFERKIVEELSDGAKKVLDYNGTIILEKPGKVSIPMEFDHLLKDRESWEKHYKGRLQFSEKRLDDSFVQTPEGRLNFKQGGLEYLQSSNRAYPLGLFCGSLIGRIRNWLGLENLSFLLIDDEKLYDEIIDTVGELSFKLTKSVLEKGAEFDFAHFWEDICCKSGPLVSPSIFESKITPHYKKITDLLNNYGINIISVDCDGYIDDLLPFWLESGVNTMFPIEVGTWNASIAPWRKKYGKKIRGVGGVRKSIFSEDENAIENEIERLKEIAELGGYIPCPDHRIDVSAKWENVQYYCELIRKTF